MIKQSKIIGMKCEETNQHDLHSVILCQGFFAKTEHFLVRMFRLNCHKSSMVYTNVFVVVFFVQWLHFYLHVTVFTKEHVKHANKGELIYR